MLSRRSSSRARASSSCRRSCRRSSRARSPADADRGWSSAITVSGRRLAFRPGLGRRRLLRGGGFRLFHGCLLCGLGRGDRAGDVAGIVEHLLHPGALRRRLRGGDFERHRRRVQLRHRRRRNGGHHQRAAAAEPLAQRIAAVGNQAEGLEREQAADRDQHDRHQPEIAQPSGHAASALDARAGPLGEGLRRRDDGLGVGRRLRASSGSARLRQMRAGDSASAG